jgi:hypothetical protein
MGIDRRDEGELIGRSVDWFAEVEALSAPPDDSESPPNTAVTGETRP